MSLSLWFWSFVVLLCGPALLGIVQQAPLWLQTGAMQGLDGFVLVSVTGIVLADILPHTLEAAGAWAIPLVALGLMGPSLVERGLHRAAERVHTLALALGMAGLVLHAGLDGVALSQGDTHPQMATAVLLHRLPEGLTIWWLLRPTYGRLVALGAVLLVAAATFLGVRAGPETIPEGPVMGLVQAFVGGSLLHVVVHRPHPLVQGAQQGAGRFSSGVGALAGTLLLSALLTHDEHGREVAESFTHLLVESAPALVFAYLAAGLVQAALPAASAKWMGRGGPLQQAMRGVAFGLPLPICSCGVVPVYSGLVRAGVPAAAGMAFLVATPELGLDAILLSWPLLGAQMAVTRVVAAALVAVGVGWLVGRTVPALTEHTREHQLHKPARGWQAQVRDGLKLGFGEILDHTGPWILLGLGLAALAAPALEGGLLNQVPRGLDVPLLALLGMPLYVCASGATPLVAVLLAHGVSPGAGLAFLLTGPATNISTFGVLARLHGRPAAWRFAIVMAVLAMAAGYATNAVLGTHLVAPPPTAEHGGWAQLQTVAVAILGVLFAVSVLRQGARGFFAQVLDFAEGQGPGAPGGHSHDHGHAHSHDHGHAHSHDHGHHHH